jgi:hypothetical protein
LALLLLHLQLCQLPYPWLLLLLQQGLLALLLLAVQQREHPLERLWGSAWFLVS